MAQIQADSAAEHSPIPVGTILNVVGGLLSLGLLAGVGVWGYRTVTTDVSEIPVIHAAKDPMRVQPEEPGGRLSGNLGFAVNRVAADGVAEKPADRLILAPAPIELSKEDIAPLTRAEQEKIAAEHAAAAGRAAAEFSLESRTVEAVLNSETGQDGMDPALALAEELLKNAKPLSDELAPMPDQNSAIAVALLRAQEEVDGRRRAAPQNGADSASGPDGTASAAEDDEIVTITPKVAPGTSLRPRARPAAVRAFVEARETVEKALTTSAPAADVIDADPASIASGTFLAQLGAYDSVETARKEWDRTALRFRDFMTEKQRVIQQASSNGRAFFRLRVKGFDDISDARHFCAALVAENAECIPLETK
ncbi:SPOR domain-containing protein [Pseudooceanicola sp. C21-150M6]|uniref:SPOR domain-containing protein n=1 Tax=Pseudooceanicola sp. C21-150M6 TaxID=3434355 RepID=UPI003D7FE985